MKTGSGKTETRYNQLTPDRNPYIERGKTCARYTQPSLAPIVGTKRSLKYKTPYQGLGSRGVNNLAAKMLLALFPPNTPIFKFVVDRLVLQQEGKEEMKTEIEAGLAKIEKAVTDEIDSSYNRAVIFVALKHMIINGNALLYIGDEGSQVYPLDRYVVVRDPVGNVLEIVIYEPTAPASLEGDFIAKLKAKSDYNDKTNNDKVLHIYTHVLLKEGKWHIHQECMGETIPGTQSTYPKNANPFIALQFEDIEGESYGRSYVDQYLGDLKSLEGLMQSVVESAAATSKTVFLVNPNGTTRAKTVSEAPNGAVREGNAADVTVIRADKGGDLQVAYSVIEMLSQRLEYSFLMHTAAQRNAERVTAEEIRYVSQELETAIGGTYSTQSHGFQLPLVEIHLNRFQRNGKMPDLPRDLVKAVITTGEAALGRGNDRSKLERFLATLNNTLGPDKAAAQIHANEAAKRLAIADGIDPEGLVRTAEELEKDADEQKAMMMAEKLGPGAMKMMGEGGLSAPPAAPQ